MTPPSPVKQGAAAHPRAAFTIVELLMAVSISVVVVVLLANVVSQAMLTSRKASNELQAMNAAAAALDLIATDLDTLAVTRQPYEYFQAFQEPNLVTAVRPMRMMMLANSAEDASSASISGNSYTYPDSGLTHAICYQVLYQDPLAGGANPLQGGTNSVMGLYRAVVSASTTFTSVMGANEFLSYWKNVGGGNIGTLMNNPQNGVTVDFVAPNVVDLEVAAYGYYLGTGTNAVLGPTQLYNPPTGAGQPFGGIQITGTGPMEGIRYGTTGAISINPSVPTTSGVTTAYPLPSNTSWRSAAYLEVSVTVIEDTAAKLWGAGKGTGKMAPAYLKVRYGHTLTRKIYLHPPQ
jgi:type II secretory pathway pseudopilin PulG